jgi:hypothetical protein
MRRAPLAILALLALAGPSLADPKAPVDDHAVAISPVALPVVWNGQVVNYIFVTAKVVLTPRADDFALRDKEPFFRDALVRAAHKTPFVLPNDLNRLDDAKLKAALYRAAVAIAGPGNVQSIVIVSETPQHFLRAPNQPPPH